MTRYVTVREAADGCSLTEKTIRRAIERGDLPAVRPRGSRRVLISADALDAWLVPVDVAPPSTVDEIPTTGPLPSRIVGSRERLRAIEGGR